MLNLVFFHISTPQSTFSFIFLLPKAPYCHVYVQLKCVLVLEDKWGRDGFAFVLDEGGMGLTTMGDMVYARPGIAEKGYMDAKLTLEVNGGHSSRPPAHSGIGIMAELVVALENNPYLPILTAENPLRGVLECQAKFSPNNISPWISRALSDGTSGVEIGKRLSKERGPMARFSMQTSQAVDIIQGGQKINALPESVTAIANYRIASHDSLDLVKNRITSVVFPIAQKHGLALHGFSHNQSAAVEKTDRSWLLSNMFGGIINVKQVLGSSRNFVGSLSLASVHNLSPSPITPTNIENGVWSLFSATIRQVFENTTTLVGKTVIPVGDIMHGNTDTIHYWNLTKDIYRFSPAREGTRLGIHTVDEHLDMDTHIEGLRFYYGRSSLQEISCVSTPWSEASRGYVYLKNSS